MKYWYINTGSSEARNLSADMPALREAAMMGQKDEVAQDWPSLVYFFHPAPPAESVDPTDLLDPLEPELADEIWKNLSVGDLVFTLQPDGRFRPDGRFSVGHVTGEFRSDPDYQAMRRVDPEMGPVGPDDGIPIHWSSPVPVGSAAELLSKANEKTMKFGPVISIDADEGEPILLAAHYGAMRADSLQNALDQRIDPKKHREWREENPHALLLFERKYIVCRNALSAVSARGGAAILIDSAISEVPYIDAYCDQYLVKGYDRGRSDLEAHAYARIQRGLTPLDGLALKFQDSSVPRDVPSDELRETVSGELLERLVRLARNIVLLSSAGSATGSASAWSVLRTFIESWTELMRIRHPQLPDTVRDSNSEELEAEMGRQLAQRWADQEVVKFQQLLYETARHTKHEDGELKAKWVRKKAEALDRLYPKGSTSGGRAFETLRENETTPEFLHLKLGVLEVGARFTRPCEDSPQGLYEVLPSPGDDIHCLYLPPATGTVEWFNDKKGSGFITPDEAGKDLRVRRSAIMGEGYKSLAKGAKVEFESEEGPKGRSATRVRVIKDESLESAAFTSESVNDHCTFGPGEEVAVTLVYDDNEDLPVSWTQLKLDAKLANFASAEGRYPVTLLHSAVHSDKIASPLLDTSPPALFELVIMPLKEALEPLDPAMSSLFTFLELVACSVPPASSPEPSG